MEDELVYLDTNILVYLQNQHSPYYTSTFEIVEELYSNEKLCYNQVVLTEFYSIITDSRKVELPWTASEAAEYIRNLLHRSSFHCVTMDILLDTMESAEKYAITRYNIYDHLIAFSMKNYGVRKIVTANEKDFIQYDFIEEIIVPENQ